MPADPYRTAQELNASDEEEYDEFIPHHQAEHAYFVPAGAHGNADGHLLDGIRTTRSEFRSLGSFITAPSSSAASASERRGLSRIDGTDRLPKLDSLKEVQELLWPRDIDNFGSFWDYISASPRQWHHKFALSYEDISNTPVPLAETFRQIAEVVFQLDKAHWGPSVYNDRASQSSEVLGQLAESAKRQRAPYPLLHGPQIDPKTTAKTTKKKRKRPTASKASPECGHFSELKSQKKEQLRAACEEKGIDLSSLSSKTHYLVALATHYDLAIPANLQAYRPCTTGEERERVAAEYNQIKAQHSELNAALLLSSSYGGVRVDHVLKKILPNAMEQQKLNMNFHQTDLPKVGKGDLRSRKEFIALYLWDRNWAAAQNDAIVQASSTVLKSQQEEISDEIRKKSCKVAIQEGLRTMNLGNPRLWNLSLANRLLGMPVSQLAIDAVMTSVSASISPEAYAEPAGEPLTMTSQPSSSAVLANQSEIALEGLIGEIEPPTIQASLMDIDFNIYETEHQAIPLPAPIPTPVDLTNCRLWPTPSPATAISAPTTEADGTTSSIHNLSNSTNVGPLSLLATPRNTPPVTIARRPLQELNSNMAALERPRLSRSNLTSTIRCRVEGFKELDTQKRAHDVLKKQVKQAAKKAKCTTKAAGKKASGSVVHHTVLPSGPTSLSPSEVKDMGDVSRRWSESKAFYQEYVDFEKDLIGLYHYYSDGVAPDDTPLDEIQISVTDMSKHFTNRKKVLANYGYKIAVDDGANNEAEPEAKEDQNWDTPQMVMRDLKSKPPSGQSDFLPLPFGVQITGLSPYKAYELLKGKPCVSVKLISKRSANTDIELKDGREGKRVRATSEGDNTSNKKHKSQ